MEQKKNKKKTFFVFARLKASLDDAQGGGSTVTEVIVYYDRVGRRHEQVRDYYAATERSITHCTWYMHRGY